MQGINRDQNIALDSYITLLKSFITSANRSEARSLYRELLLLQAWLRDVHDHFFPPKNLRQE